MCRPNEFLSSVGNVRTLKLFTKAKKLEILENVESRAVPISLFADYTDTTYFLWLKQPIPIIRPIMNADYNAN